MSEYSPFGTPNASPVRGPTHAQWLRRQLSGHGSESTESDAWPDLLVDRRSIVERRIWKVRDPVALERNNLVKIRYTLENMKLTLQAS